MEQPGVTPPQSEVPGSPITGESSSPFSPVSPAPAVEPGPKTQPTVPDYELLRRIGHGAYGEVWLARSQATGALRAAKIVWRHTFENGRPFQREFAGIQRFERISREHPSQLALFHIGRNEPAGYFYYVMELADPAERAGEDGGLRMENGGKSEFAAGHPRSSIFDPRLYTAHTLRADLERGRLPAAKVLEIGLALSEALLHLHSNGLVHRDVKPSNVIFVNGRPKLADIGLVTDASDRCSIVGTEGYLPPEGPGTPQADIFALGKMLYEAATGLDRREFPKLPEDLRSWPDAAQVFELNEIILKACAQDAKDRYQTCEEMHADLELLQRGKSVKQKRTRQQRWAIAKKVLVTAAVLGVIAASATMLWRQSRVTRPLSSNPQAEALYQQAVYELQGGTLDRAQQAYTNLAEAVKLDPRFVDAYYKMFETYFYGHQLPPHYNRAYNMRMVADKLRVLSPDSAQYHTVNSLVKFEDWKFEEAIKEAALAKEIDPNFVRAHGLSAFYVLYAHGDADAALREYRIAEQLDPADTIIQNGLGGPFYFEHKFDQAIAQYNKAIQLEPRAAQVHYDLASAYAADKQYDKALDEEEQADLLNGENTENMKAWYQKLRLELHDNGPRGLWETRLDGARKDAHADPYGMAELCARLGYTDEVFSLLNRAYKEHNGSMIFILGDDCFDPLHNDPRFKELLEKIGFTNVMSLQKK
jgi:serine/threonine protein kinase